MRDAGSDALITKGDSIGARFIPSCRRRPRRAAPWCRSLRGVIPQIWHSFVAAKHGRIGAFLCPLWVISGHTATSAPYPLYPR